MLGVSPQAPGPASWRMVASAVTSRLPLVCVTGREHVHNVNAGIDLLCAGLDRRRHLSFAGAGGVVDRFAGLAEYRVGGALSR